MSSLIDTVSTIQVNVNNLKAKLTTKHDLYQFVTLHLNAFLPAERHVTVYYIKDIISGTKKIRSSSTLFL